MDNDSNKSKNSVEISATPQSTPSNKDGTIDVKSVDFNQYLNNKYQKSLSNQDLELKRCVVVFLGNSDVEIGRATSALDVKLCNVLECTQCQQNVEYFVNKKWDSSVDQAFLKDSANDKVKLGKKLADALGEASYCCQCSWYSTDENYIKSSKVSEAQHWICRGH